MPEVERGGWIIAAGPARGPARALRRVAPRARTLPCACCTAGAVQQAQGRPPPLTAVCGRGVVTLPCVGAFACLPILQAWGLQLASDARRG